MDASFTLPYSQFVVADLFIKAFQTKDGYSVLVPVSRTEKGIDLVLTRRTDRKTRALTFQIQTSRTYAGTENKRRRYQHVTWTGRFEVRQQADFVVLFGLYPPDDQSGVGLSKSHVMIFSNADMAALIASAETRDGNPDKLFGFGFYSADEAYLTGGSKTREHVDYSHHLFTNQTAGIRAALGEQSLIAARRSGRY
jgi:hypothetical protein